MPADELQSTAAEVLGAEIRARNQAMAAVSEFLPHLKQDGAVMDEMVLADRVLAFQRKRVITEEVNPQRDYISSNLNKELGDKSVSVVSLFMCSFLAAILIICVSLYNTTSSNLYGDLESKLISIFGLFLGLAVMWMLINTKIDI